jgi:hypothetical protein
MPSRRAEAAALVAGVLAACASIPPAPTQDVARRAREAGSYSGELRVRLDGPQFRGRARVLVGFERPDALRLELPGPLGPRLVLVARDGALAAAFPSERAVFRGGAGASDLEALLGVSLASEELMDLLLGVASPRLRSCRFEWGPLLPKRIEAVLPDGARLSVRVDAAETGADLPAAAFEDPARDDYRTIGAEEARRLWSR